MSVVSNKGVASLHKIDGCIAFDTDIDVGAYCCDAGTGGGGWGWVEKHVCDV